MQIKIMHKIENNEIKTHKPPFDTSYNLGNFFGRKPCWKVRPLCYLSLNIKWLRVQRSKVCGLWATTVYKSSLYPLSLSLSPSLLVYETNAIEKNRIPFLRNGPVIIQPDSLLVVKFDYFNS